jgi:hypothetical protein
MGGKNERIFAFGGPKSKIFPWSEQARALNDSRGGKLAGGSAKPKFSLLVLPISRSPCEISEAFATSDQDGRSPRRAVRDGRRTAREFLHGGPRFGSP